MSKEEIENTNGVKTAEEIQKALKEFESLRHIEYGKAETNSISVPPGQGDFSEVNQALVQLNQKQKEENVFKEGLKKNPKSSGMASFLVRHSGGILKNENQANFVLLALAILIFIISGVFFYIGLKGNSVGKTKEISPNIVLSKS